jgi:hypothetical protein
MILWIVGTSKTAEQLLTALGWPWIAQTPWSNQGLACSNKND